MAKCDYCGSTILFGAKKHGEHRFCNDTCLQRGTLLEISRQIPENVIQQQVWAVHQGLCPKCGGKGPVDVHTSHQIWSALFLTSWKSLPQLSCRACGLKSQAGNMVFSLALGWWGFPWGFIMTPVQIGRNIFAMAKPPSPDKPTAQLEKVLRLSMAATAAKHAAAKNADAAAAGK